MVFYSEDNEYMASSIMLSKVLNIRFVNSNTNIRSIIEDKRNRDMIIYLDVVPDNGNLVYLYDELRSFPDLKERNINIIPIPCIEYFIIRALCKLKVNFEFRYDWVIIVLLYTLNKITIAKPWPPKSIGYNESFKTFEKQCKLILSNCSSMYCNFNTVNSKDKELLNSISWFLNNSYSLTVYDKAKCITAEMPMTEFNDLLDSTTPKEYISTKANKIRKDYDSWIKSFKKVNLSSKWWEAEGILREIEVFKSTL